ncbi:MAG: MFS transporter [Verrucomicrobiota bacterium]
MTQLPPEKSMPRSRLWTAGTLVYTPLGLAALFFWLLGGDFIWSLKERAVPPILQLLMRDHGASDVFAGLMVGSFPSLLALVASPIVSYHSDRFRGRWGRRIPFLAALIPLVAIAMPGLAASPWLGVALHHALGVRSPGADTSVLVCLALFWSLYEFSSIVGAMLFNALINDVVPPAVIGRFFGAFRGLSLLAGIVFNFYLFARATTDYVPIFVGFGVFNVAALALLCLKVKEGSYPPPPVTDKGVAGIVHSVRDYFRDCFGYSFYWILFAALTLGGIAFSPVNLFSVFFAKGLIDPTRYGELVALTYVISLGLAYPLGALADRVHPLRVGTAALALYAAAALWGWLFARTPLTFEIAFVLHGVISGIYFTGTASLMLRLLPRGKFAQYASAGGILGCVFSVATGPVCGLILDHMNHDYHLTYLMSATLALVALVSFGLLHRAFLAHGGDDHFAPPGRRPRPGKNILTPPRRAPRRRLQINLSMPHLADFAPLDFTPLLASIETEIFHVRSALRMTAWLTKEPLPFKSRVQGEERALEIGGTWGAAIFDCAWFRFEGEAEPSEEPLALLIDLNGELCLYDEQGHPLAGLTSMASSFDPLLGKAGKRVFWLPEERKNGGPFVYWGDAGYNDLFGRLCGTGRIVEAHVAVCRPDVLRLYRDVAFLADYAHACKGQGALGRRLRTILQDIAACWLPEEPASARDALAAAARFWEMKAGEGLLRLHAAGHAHLDLAWLWPEREGKRKAVRTFATALRLLRTYPDYLFSASQAQMYAWIKETEPALFRRVVDAVKDGRIEPVGDSWVESDTNVPGGESLVRQILEGRHFFQREFGTTSNVIFLPDVFGYSAALPQIARGCGMDYFTTQKLSWNKVNKFPHQTFWWEGPDGSRVLAHMLPEETYNSPAAPSNLLKAQKNYADIGRCDQALMLFGIGDGGGGPGEEHLENLRRSRSAFGLPQVTPGRVGDFFRELSRNAEGLPTWKGELYLEAHQGTLTTHAEIKQANRRAEILLREVEWLLAAEKILGANPKEDLRPLWRQILFLQFHDILPGSSIRRVYDEALPVYRKTLGRLEDLRASLSVRIGAAAAGDESRSMVLNTLPWRREGWAMKDGAWHRYRAPALSWTPLLKEECTAPVLSDRTVDNGLVTFTLAGQGGISSLRLADGTEFVAAGELTALPRLYHDAGDAWDTPLAYRRAPIRPMEFISCEEIRTNNEAGFLLLWRLGESTIKQRLTLRSDSPLVFVEYDIDWHRPWTLLRAHFPCAVPHARATYEIQFGWIERAPHDNTSWDAARHEAPHQQWTDLSNAQKGLAILNDGKFGSVIKDGTIELSLLRCVPYPGLDAAAAERAGETVTAFSGLGQHRCRLALYPHLGGHLDAGVWRRAREFNLEPHVGTVESREHPALRLEGLRCGVRFIRPQDFTGRDRRGAAHQSLHQCRRHAGTSAQVCRRGSVGDEHARGTAAAGRCGWRFPARVPSLRGENAAVAAALKPARF